eukprot:1802998-Prymnesium_polylepis.1
MSTSGEEGVADQSLLSALSTGAKAASVRASETRPSTGMLKSKGRLGSDCTLRSLALLPNAVIICSR